MTNETPETPALVTVVDDKGIPDAVIDIDVIQKAATRLMYDMAAKSHDVEAMRKVNEQYLTEVGPELFGYVAGHALKLMAECVVEPLLVMCDKAKTPRRADLVAAAENANSTLRDIPLPDDEG